MKSMIKLKLKEINNTYEKMEKSRKRVILFGVFIGLSLVFTETLLFKSMDKYQISEAELKKELDSKESKRKEKETILLKNAYKTEKSLLKQKTDLIKEIDTLLQKDKSKNYIAAESVPKLIGDVVSKINQLKMVSFKNVLNGSAIKEETIIVKHVFSLSVTGSFQGVYDLLVNLENIDGINVSNVSLEKDKDLLTSTIDFYVLNTTKNVINF